MTTTSRSITPSNHSSRSSQDKTPTSKTNSPSSPSTPTRRYHSPKLDRLRSPSVLFRGGLRPDQQESIKDSELPLVRATFFIAKQYLSLTKRKMRGFSSQTRETNASHQYIPQKTLQDFFKQYHIDPRPASAEGEGTKKLITSTQYAWLSKKNNQLGIRYIDDSFIPITALEDHDFLFVHMLNGEVRICKEQTTGHLILATGASHVLCAGGFSIRNHEIHHWHHESGAYKPSPTMLYLTHSVSQPNSNSFISSPFPFQKFDPAKAFSGEVTPWVKSIYQLQANQRETAINQQAASSNQRGTLIDNWVRFSDESDGYTTPRSHLTY